MFEGERRTYYYAVRYVYFTYAFTKGEKNNQPPHKTLESTDNKATNETKLIHEGLQMPSHHFPAK